MRSVGVVVGLVLALGVGYFAFGRSVASSPGQAPPQEQIDVVAIRQTLLTVGQAERQFLVAHGSYGTLPELAQERLLPGGLASMNQRGYLFTDVVDGDHGFTITAVPTDPNKADWPTLSITESQEVVQR